MARYEELSRRGLIGLDKDYDKENKNSLKKFLDTHKENYEDIRPVEQVTARLDEVCSSLVSKGGVVSDTLLKRVDHVFDNIVQALGDELTKVEEVTDEKVPDNDYPDTDDDVEDDEDGEDADKPSTEMLGKWKIISF